MSQKVVFIQLENENYATNHYGETSIPDEEYVDQLARDYDLFGDVEAHYEWYDIGEGESGMDEFFDEDKLADMYETGNFIKACESNGYDCELVEHGTISVTVDEEA